MIQEIPTFAVVGAVNHGKSSVVSTLAEDDNVRVSDTPGETVVNKRFSLRDLLVFFDTPGFQNARKALAEIQEAHAHRDPLQPFRRFIERHRNSVDFDAECQLLRPVVDGAGIIYVVDGSRPVREMNICEMEILRRTGAPRLAIINRTGKDDRVDEWKGWLNQHFNIVREFDAHHATYSDRKDLLESLAIIERGWKDRLSKAVGVLEADRNERVLDSAALIADFLINCLQHSEKARIDDEMDEVARKQLGEQLKLRYMAAIASMERSTHGKIIALYAHNRVAPDVMPADLFKSDLFGEETWQLFGLGVSQLMGLSMLAGGMAGAGIDAATLGHSLGIGAAIGAAAGAGGAYVLGKRRPEISISWPTDSFPYFVKSVLPKNAVRFGGGNVVVGPFRAENFPWILLDRVLCTFAYVYTRSHARRDDGVANVKSLLWLLKERELTVAHWTDAERDACHGAFKTVRGGKRPGEEQVAKLRNAINEALNRVAAAERAIGEAQGRPG